MNIQILTKIFMINLVCTADIVTLIIYDISLYDLEIKYTIISDQIFLLTFVCIILLRYVICRVLSVTIKPLSYQISIAYITKKKKK